MAEQKFPFGAQVRDAITGFTGTVTGFTNYITGCKQYLVQPPVKAEGGDFVEARWLDEDRLARNGGTPITLKPTVNGPDKAAPIR